VTSQQQVSHSAAANPYLTTPISSALFWLQQHAILSWLLLRTYFFD
jgi:hypothetical protein